jgi:DNA-binding PadR family transcriptional regulator
VKRLPPGETRTDGDHDVKLPRITHLQFSVLASLRGGEQAGKAVRGQLAELGLRRSGPAFYQLMSRLEDAGLVEGRYDQKVIDGQIIKERFYAITEDGLDAWQATRDFYVETIRAAEQAPTESA